MLKVNFAELSPGETLKLVANLPYNVSTAILQRLIKYRHSFSEMVLMFQREVVDHSSPRSGKYRPRAIYRSSRSLFKSECLFDVPPAAFRPSPKVWSLGQTHAETGQARNGQTTDSNVLSAPDFCKNENTAKQSAVGRRGLGSDPERITDQLLAVQYRALATSRNLDPC